MAACHMGGPGWRALGREPPDLMRCFSSPHPFPNLAPQRDEAEAG